MKTQHIEGRSLYTGPPDASTRADMYGLLSALFLRPVGQKLLQYVSDSDLFGELPLLYGRSGKAPTKTGCAGGFLPNDPVELRQEYMDLFAVPTGRYVFPFEDVYRGTVNDGQTERKGPLLGPCAVAVKSIFRRSGAQMDPSCRELPTHIGVELSFMRFLCLREAEAAGESHTDKPPGTPSDRTDWTLHENRMVQLAFLTEHLNEWFPRLSLSIQANASGEFYRRLALLTDQVLTWDTSSLLETTRFDVE